ncbi:MAG TPA: hypothetical protein VEZ26_09515 [Sphingomonadaceae bacterium]|nr:hypothetical protein [Sphingomonadaceae bacterium]
MRIRRLALALGLALGAWAAGPAGASSDFGCSPDWTLDRSVFDCASSAVMSPANDTRVNLALLLRDRAGLASRPGKYPVMEWDYGFGRNFFDWHLFGQASYPAPVEQDASDYYGSRCISLKGGDAAFASALAANAKLPGAEREALLAARAQLAPICMAFGASYWLSDGKERNAPSPAWPVNVASKPGKDFAAYLAASAAFYGEDWNAARGGFAGLVKAGDPWVRETARYMQARVELNAAQARAFDEWGYFGGAEKTDQDAARRAGQALTDYLKAYPKGAYAASAKGLQRRALWLGGDLAGLSDTYEALLAATVPGSAVEEVLIEEVDNKLLLAKGAESAIDTPLLLATYDLMRMRSSGLEGEGAYEYGPKPIDEAELAAQEPIFKGRGDLYQFLRATYAFYIGGNAQDVLERIPDASATTAHSALDFSRQMLRGQALAALHDPGEEAFWRRLIPGATGLYQRPAAELGLALHWQQAGKADRVFGADSPVSDSMIRKILLARTIGPDILRREAGNAARPDAERQLALFTLLYKQLSRGFYGGFLKDLPLVPAGADKEAGLWWLETAKTIPVGLFTAGRFSDGYACPKLEQTVALLAKNARDVKGRLCLGDFYRLNGFDDFSLYSDTEQAGFLGSGKEAFPGRPIARGTFYRSIMADPAAAPADKAYALYRAVRCYAPSGINGCGDDDAPVEQRRAWFQTLKRQYGDTRWAKGLDYYW